MLEKMLWLFPLAGLAATAPIPRDPLEVVNGAVQVAAAPQDRQAALQLLTRARDNFALRGTHQGFDLKVSFTVDSSGETNYDRAWKMEDQFAPGKGHRWTAESGSGYGITALATSAGEFSEGTASAVPLRLHQARGVLFDPIQSAAVADRGSIRTSTVDFQGVPLTCILLSPSRDEVYRGIGRGWDETEECIDPLSGLLRIHSQVPGLYALYDYTHAAQFDGHVLPGSVTITEGGRAVLTISVESLKPAASFDPRLFAPTEAMKAHGPATAMASATKIFRVTTDGAVPADAAMRPVCVFGILTPTGQLVEAHSLQPSDANSGAALADARAVDFSPKMEKGAGPRQRLVFVIEMFAAQ